jgi:hypothetical protein
MIENCKFSYIVVSLMESPIVVVKVIVTNFSFSILCIFTYKIDMKLSFVYQRHLDESSKSCVTEIWTINNIVMIVSD